MCDFFASPTKFIVCLGLPVFKCNRIKAFIKPLWPVSAFRYKCKGIMSGDKILLCLLMILHQF